MKKNNIIQSPLSNSGELKRNIGIHNLLFRDATLFLTTILCIFFLHFHLPREAMNSVDHFFPLPTSLLMVWCLSEPDDQPPEDFGRMGTITSSGDFFFGSLSFWTAMARRDGGMASPVMSFPDCQRKMENGTRKKSFPFSSLFSVVTGTESIWLCVHSYILTDSQPKAKKHKVHSGANYSFDFFYFVNYRAIFAHFFQFRCLPISQFY